MVSVHCPRLDSPTNAFSEPTGLTVPEIAEELYLSPATVRTHVQNIYSKLGVHGRIEAIQVAKACGLL